MVMTKDSSKVTNSDPQRMQVLKKNSYMKIRSFCHGASIIVLIPPLSSFSFAMIEPVSVRVAPVYSHVLPA